MTIPIHPKALKSLRSRLSLTQEGLCDATRGPNKVSLATIKRIESPKCEVHHANERVALSLAKALGVNIEDLSKEPTERDKAETTLRKFGYRPFRTMIDPETALAFNMVQEIYGIPVRAQIEMAPLFMALFAEGSLDWRRKQVDAIEAASDELQSLARGHSCYAYMAGRVDEGAAEERSSIANKDVFGVDVSDDAFHCGYDRSVNNPFADYLKEFARDVAADIVSFDEEPGWKTSPGLPEYRIGAEIIDQLTNGNSDAEYALMRGHVRIKDIPRDLNVVEKADERVAWMIAQIPEEELAERRKHSEEMRAQLNLDAMFGTKPKQSPDGGNND